MKIGIHQPNFLPWSGYFHKILKSDKFIFLDDALVSKKSLDYINRSSFLTNGKIKYFTIPIYKNFKQKKIKDLEIDNSKNWKGDFINFIKENYRGAKFYNQYESLFFSIKSREFKNLIELNIFFIDKICDLLKMKKKFLFSSDYQLNSKSTYKLVELIKLLNGTEYLSGQGGKKYLNEKLFFTNKINLNYLNYKQAYYNQQKSIKFIPGLSILDEIMNKDMNKLTENLK